MEHSRQNSRWDLVPGMCPERFGKDLCPRSRAGFEGGFGTPGSLGIKLFPEKQAGKSLGRLNPDWSQFQDLPSPLDRSTAPISAAGAAGTSWNYGSSNPGGKWCGKDTAQNIPALGMNPTRGNFLELGWAGKKTPRAESSVSRASQSMGEKSWNGITGFYWFPTVLG